MRDPNLGHPMSRSGRIYRLEMHDAAASRAHIEHLTAIGMTHSMIARAAGTAQNTIRKITLDQPTVSPTIEAQILRVTPRPMHHQAVVLSFGVIRRLQGLAVQGWSLPMVGAEIGMDNRALHTMMRGRRTYWRVHADVAAVFDAWHLRDGGSPRAKAWAASGGFTHPLDWEDIDNFYESPSAPERMNDAEYRMGEIDHLRGMGLSSERIAERLGMTLRALERWELRHREVAA